MFLRLFLKGSRDRITLTSFTNLFSHYGILYKQPINTSNILRTVSNSSTKNVEVKIDSTSPIRDSSENEEKFITIYTNPGIKYMALINRAVYIPTIFMIPTYPIAAILFYTDLIPFRTFCIGIFIYTYVCAVLHLLAFHVWRRIGFLYVNEDVTKLKIGYVSYWGRRQNVVVPVNTVMTFSDVHSSPIDFFYRKVKTFDSGFFGAYKLDPYYGEILKPQLFEKVFGSTKVTPAVFDKLNALKAKKQ